MGLTAAVNAAVEARKMVVSCILIDRNWLGESDELRRVSDRQLYVQVIEYLSLD